MSGGFTTPAYPSADLVAFATALFERAGLDPEEAGTVAEVLVEGDLLGHPTHGLALAAPYLARSRTAAWPARARPAVVSDHDGATCWDGRRLPGRWPVVEAIEQALATCRRTASPR